MSDAAMRKGKFRRIAGVAVILFFIALTLISVAGWIQSYRSWDRLEYRGWQRQAAAEHARGVLAVHLLTPSSGQGTFALVHAPQYYSALSSRREHVLGKGLTLGQFGYWHSAFSASHGEYIVTVPYWFLNLVAGALSLVAARRMRRGASRQRTA
jgi:hypothetical protein